MIADLSTTGSSRPSATSNHRDPFAHDSRTDALAGGSSCGAAEARRVRLGEGRATRAGAFVPG